MTKTYTHQVELNPTLSVDQAVKRYILGVIYSRVASLGDRKFLLRPLPDYPAMNIT